MAFTQKQVLYLVQLSVLLLSSLITVLGHIDDSTVSFAQAPHYLPAHPPVGATTPHHHHHHHHAKPPSTTPPPVNSPTQPPVKPPSPPLSKPPTQPPVKRPTPSPAKPPTEPPAKRPSPLPAKPPSPPTSHPVPPRKLVAVQGVVFCKSCKFTGIDTLTAATALANATVRLICTNTKYHLIQEAKTNNNGYFFIMAQKLTTAGSHKCKVFLASSPLATCNVPTDLHAGRKGAILMPDLKPPPVHNPLKFQLFNVGPFAFEPAKKCH